MWPLAYAQGTDESGANLQLMLVGLVLAAASAAIAAVPIWGARRRRHPHIDVIGAAMLIWAIATAWSGISLFAARSDWQKEKTLRLESGYDSSVSDAALPEPPIAFWSALAGGWLLVNGWAFLTPVRVLPHAPADRALTGAKASVAEGDRPVVEDRLSS